MTVAATAQNPESHEPRDLARADAVLVCPLRRQIILLLVLSATLLINLDPAVGCPVCFGDPDSEMARGAMWGILVLGIVVYGVLMGMVGIGATWYIRDRKRGK